MHARINRLVRATGPALPVVLALVTGCEGPASTTTAVELDSNHTALYEAGAWGFAWANNATSSSYTPDANFARSSSGGAIRANRLGTGSYRVDFSGLGGTGGFAIAVAVGVDN